MKVTVTLEDSSEQTIELSERALNKVLYDFNPGGHLGTKVYKALHAAILELLMPVAAQQDLPNARTASMAIDHTEIGQMLAVKSQFARD